jgi:hypothetical protein
MEGRQCWSLVRSMLSAICIELLRRRRDEILGCASKHGADKVHFSRPQRISPAKQPRRGCLGQLLVPDRAGGAISAWWSCENHGHRVDEYARYGA